jgi:NAD(P)-dependent dehydrogenase (short-subunit alcohol dehydrogenase family)
LKASLRCGSDLRTKVLRKDDIGARLQFNLRSVWAAHDDASATAALVTGRCQNDLGNGTVTRHRQLRRLGSRLATAKAFAESGASIVLADSDEASVRSADDALNARDHKALAIHCDVSDDARVEAMVAQTAATFGRLDAAYNNAGIQNILAETADAKRKNFDRVIAVNLRGVWSCIKFQLHQMRKQQSGAIVNSSSPITRPRMESLDSRQAQRWNTLERAFGSTPYVPASSIRR